MSNMDNLLYICIWLTVLITVMSKDHYTDSGEYYRSYSQLTEVPADIPEGVRQIYLHGNQITVLKANSFVNLKNLTKLDVAMNRIVRIETGAFRGLGLVYKINLYKNKLELITGGMWIGLRSLRVLILSDNKITSLAPGSFWGLARLEMLSLWSNEIREIRADVLEGLLSLKSLMLNENHLKTILPETFRNLPNLKVLRLQDNGLTTFPEEALVDPDCPDDHPDSLTLGINHNRLQCDSRLCWLKKAEAAGWITLSNIWHNPPECVNTPGTPWEHLNLTCDQ